MSTATTYPRPFTKESLTVVTVAVLMGCKADSGLLNLMNDMRCNGKLDDANTYGAVHRAVLLEMLSNAMRNCE